MVQRDNFTQGQKAATFAASGDEVKLLWRDEFRNAPVLHYMCAHCRFVHSDKSLFEVDHIVSCLEGGSANRERLDRIARLQAEVALPLDRQDIGVLMSANLNNQLLCHGCNQGKKSKGMRPDEIPAGCGFAYRRHDDDMNPDHIDGGAPTPVGYVLPRYRRP
ncbi:MAG TPA: hypothetical protein VG456_15525 [Candidatus Sulfopaludibacter sp.]|nr:hypothetical protein [Candidatus Sulfopaludibacter sp.]